MPGLSVVRGDGVDVGEPFDRALGATEVFDHYEADTALRTDDAVIGRTTYDGYPVRSLDTEHGTAFLEGRLYDVDDEAAHLERVAGMIAEGDVADLRDWVRARDGEYLICLVGDDEVALLNDPFARLPAYYAAVDGTVTCSRELGFVRAFARHREEPLALDRLTAAQMICFGYTLGTRTTFEGVREIPPGSLVRFDGRGSDSVRDDRPDGVRDDRPEPARGDRTEPVRGDRTEPARDDRHDPARDDQHDSVRNGRSDPVRDGDDSAAGAVEITSVYDHDFETCEHADRDVAANARELADRLLTACRRRASPDRPTVVSLSGGLDSRTVAAAYDAAGVEASTATFRHAGDRNAPEVAAAGAVAECLDLDWTVYDVAETPALRQTLLDTKQGMNYLGMAYVLDFFEQLRERQGTTTCVTGDGGDKLLVGLEPTERPDSMADLVDYAIDVNSRTSIGEAAAIAGVDPAALRASVAERIRSYPESDLDRRYVHFLVRERGVNFLVQGEDRNRYYAWSTSPFYDLSVFEYAMNCPDEQKAYRQLQCAILEQFAPETVDVSYPNYGAPVTTRRYRFKQFVYDALERYPGVRDRVVDLVSSGGGADAELVESIRADLPGLEWAGCSRTEAAEVLASPGDYSGTQLQSLATVAALASDLRAESDAGVGSRARSTGESIDESAVASSDSARPDDVAADDHERPRAHR